MLRIILSWGLSALLLLILISAGFGETVEKPVVESVVVAGNSHTTEATIRSLCRIQQGQKITDDDIRHCRSSLHRAGIFQSVEVYRQKAEDKERVVIEVEEKQTLVPIPFAFYSGSTRALGFYLFEANFLGRNKKVFIGGLYSNYGWKVNLGYIAPTIGESNFTGTLFGVLQDYEFENTTADSSLVQRYESFQGYCKYTAGYRWNRVFTVSVAGRVGRALVKNLDTSVSAKPEEGAMTAQGLQIDYDDRHHTGLFQYGLDLQMYGLYGLSYYGMTGSWYEYAADGAWSLPLFQRHRIELYGVAGAGSTPMIFQQRIGSGKGFRSLPADTVAADTYISSSLSWEMPLWRLNWGTITGLTFWEQGWYNAEYTAAEYFYGPGAGIRFYLTRIAIPAMGFNIAFNIPAESLAAAFSIGMQM